MTLSGDRPLNTVRKSDGPTGLGGWLILPILGLAGTILLTLYNLSGFFREWEGVRAIIDGSTPALVSMRLPLAISFTLGIALVIVAAICLHRIFTYSPSVPKMMTIFYVGLVVTTLGEIAADNMISGISGAAIDPGNTRELIRVLASAAIWIPYFWRSRRVANTFRLRETKTESQIGEIFS